MIDGMSPGDSFVRADEEWMRLALDQAAACVDAGDVPVGAVVVSQDGDVLARERNRREERQDPTAHAEILAPRAAAGVLGSWRLLVLGAWDPKTGATGSTRDIVRDTRLNHRVDVVGGVLEAESAALLRSFFAARRQTRR